MAKNSKILWNELGFSTYKEFRKEYVKKWKKNNKEKIKGYKENSRLKKNQPPTAQKGDVV